MSKKIGNEIIIVNHEAFIIAYGTRKEPCQMVEVRFEATPNRVAFVINYRSTIMNIKACIMAYQLGRTAGCNQGKNKVQSAIKKALGIK